MSQAGRVVALIQARCSSRRLPGKVLADLAGAPMLLRQVERVARARRVDALLVVTSEERSDDPIVALCQKHQVECFRGSLEDVLDRCVRAARAARASHVVRLTGDCPLGDPALIDAVVDLHLREGCDYSSNIQQRRYPDGLDVEVIRVEALETAWREAERPSEREHVTPFLRNQPARFSQGSLVGEDDHSDQRWVVDEPRDLDFVRAVYEALLPTRPEFGHRDVLALLEQRPELRALNAGIDHDAGIRASLAEDARHWVSPRYARSHAALERAERSIPLGAQTFSKSPTHLPRGAAPHFAVRGQGGRIWDVDDNEYIDFVMALAAVTLGYRDADVDEAVRRQLDQGVSFSLSHGLEADLAERLVEIIPCAERVRFGKNGSDATAAAIRVARACTGRDHVLVCGYHGWQDWYIGSTSRHRGVPEATRALTHAFVYNDLASLDALFEGQRGQVAAVILEPMADQWPAKGFLEGLRERCSAEGALLVFDETITGFRFDLGGAQALFGVEPDLATFGKGIANGWPLSALVGRAEFMESLEEIFFSTTFGGETVSLAAACAVIDKMRREPVLETLHRRGEAILAGAARVIEAQGASEIVSLSGHPAWSFLHFRPTPRYDAFALKSFFQQEVFARGILTLGTHNLCYAHGEDDIARLLDVYDEVIRELVRAASAGNLLEALDAPPVAPLFTVRGRTGDA